MAPDLLSMSSTGRRRRRSSSETNALVDTVNWVLGALEKDSRFFQQNPPPPLPHLENSQVELGKVLGEGEFGIVSEVTEFRVEDPCHCSQCLQSSSEKATADGAANSSKCDSPPLKKLVVPCDTTTSSTNSSPVTKDMNVDKKPRRVGSRVSFADVPITIEDIQYNVDQHAADGKATTTITAEVIRERSDEFDYSSSDDNEDTSLNTDSEEDEDSIPTDFEQREQRGFMRAHCMRGGLARYAVKCVRDDVPDEMKEDAAIDLASEAKFLASLTHPNIVRLRALVGKPGEVDFQMVMDRLYSTLGQKIGEWRKAEKEFRGPFGNFGLLGRHFGRRQQDLDSVRIDRMVALYDVARAMRYLHSYNVIYRDLKPENIGFDVRGDAKVFDFGLAKELKPRDLIEPPDGYEASGLTGSRRYMSPETVLCKPYGLSADVYSYAILFWQVMALEMPFIKYNFDQHFTKVVLNGERPKRLSFLSPMATVLLEECWSGDRSKRPTFKRVCEILKAELSTVEHNSSRGEFNDRTTHLMDLSYNSRFGYNH